MCPILLLSIDDNCIFGIKLELVCSRGSCGTIFSHVNILNDITSHEPRLQASSSSIPGIRIWSIRLLAVPFQSVKRVS